MLASKTHEMIMARFIPIAPKPVTTADEDSSIGAELLLRARPCRARKRARAAPATRKRPKTVFPLLPSPVSSGFPLDKPAVCCFDPSALLHPSPGPTRPEQDLLQQKLQKPIVIYPQPVRPVGSSITVTACISHGTAATGETLVAKRAEEVEEEVEEEALPAVVTDSGNRVRLANSAYRELVGQPECPWLDCTALGPNKSRSSRRIGGEVVLHVSEPRVLPASADGFSCRAKIEWASSNGRKSVVDAPCDVVRLYCESKDYMLTWRFRTIRA